MISINSQVSFKSLETIQPAIELPDFVVISGLNGAGKSHLLRGIVDQHITVQENNRPLNPIKFVDHNMLAPPDGVIISVDDLRQRSNEVLNLYNNYKNHKRTNRQATLEQMGIGDQHHKLIRTIAKEAGKNLDNLSDSDFFLHYPLNDGIVPQDVFYQNFSSLFKRYHVKLLDNKFNRFLNQEGTPTAYLSDEEFTGRYGEPPWVFVNKIIREANLDYHINSPENVHRDAPFQLKLINDINGAEVNFSDLSSGEKVLMSLALSLYNSQFDMDFPKVLLMDEPDSHLHPSMTKQFLDVIQNVFVTEKSVKVIITTHSPSTVALAPQEALYLMNKIAPRVEKTTKDRALRILTSGVPTLSINYENRRQVFVESKYDVIFYESVYEKLKVKLIPEISINFISSGVGGVGNCDQVKEVVNTLTGYGNHSIYGIIDWDMRNNSDDFVKVLGEGKRYSLENYIFDPILLAAFLFRERFIDRAQLGLDDGDRYTDFINFDDAKLQAVANVIVNQVGDRIGPQPDMDLQESEYVGGKRVNLPSWFLRIQGHRLEEIIKELFPQLRRYQREGDLKKEIINKVIDDIPDFIPMDILITMREIQNYQA